MYSEVVMGSIERYKTHFIFNLILITFVFFLFDQYLKKKSAVLIDKTMTREEMNGRVINNDDEGSWPCFE